MDNSERIEHSFKPLIGLPCWNLRRGHGSFLTMEFGDPHLRIREPKDGLRGRLVVPSGKWHLWICGCAWTICDHEHLIAESESADDDITRSIAFLDGQAFVNLKAGALAGAWTFCFDLGGILATTPYDQESDQWILYEPDGWKMTSDAVGDVRRED
jgi:hypothetical protein